MLKSNTKKETPKLYPKDFYNMNESYFMWIGFILISAAVDFLLIRRDILKSIVVVLFFVATPIIIFTLTQTIKSVLMYFKNKN